MTRPTYDPMRPPAPRFPRHRFEAAGLSADAVTRLSDEYDGMGYDERVRFARDATRSPNEELSRRYADGSDAGPSPAMLSPEELANQHKADELKRAAQNAGLPSSGTKVELATRLVEAGATGDLPVITPEQAASAPQSPADAPPAPTPPEVAPEPTAAPTAPAQATPAEPNTPPAADTAPAAPAAPPAAPADGVQVAPQTPTAPAAGTDSQEGQTP